MSQQQSLKNDQYPKTLADATQALDNHKHDNAKDKKSDKEKQSGHGNGSGNGSGTGQNSNVSPLELSFAQMMDGHCHCCGKKGHWANKCNKRNEIPKEQWAINIAKKRDAAFHQMQNPSPPPPANDAGTAASNAGPPSVVSAPATTSGWAGAQVERIKGVQCFIADRVDMRKVLLLDNETTSSIFCNEDYVYDIRNSKTDLELDTNGHQEKGHCAWILERGMV